MIFGQDAAARWLRRLVRRWGPVAPATKTKPMKHIEVKTNKGTMRAEVIRENPKTWIVKLPDGNIIKRHKTKHAA